MTRPAILFVCLGNICRSPMAEGVFRRMNAARTIRRSELFRIAVADLTGNGMKLVVGADVGLKFRTGLYGTTIGAVCGVMPGGSSRWRYYFRVPSISAAVEALKAVGGTVSMGPHEVPGGDQIIIGSDPQGAEFALVGKA